MSSILFVVLQMMVFSSVSLRLANLNSHLRRPAKSASAGDWGRRHQGLPGDTYVTPCLQGTQNPKNKPKTKTTKTQTQKNKSTSKTNHSQPKTPKKTNRLQNKQSNQKEPQKMQNTVKKPRKKVKASYIIWTDKEYARLEKQSQTRGETIPGMVKKHYLEHPIPMPLIGSQEAQAQLTDLKRIGNNVNQIAKQLNSGIRHGFHKELEGIYQQLLAYGDRLSGAHGDR